MFQLTYAQWHKTKGTQYTGARTNQPIVFVSYDDIRGATNSVPVIDWPATGSLVKPSSFLGQLRTKTGLTNFDLPTEAQWEYACRAKTTTFYNDGINGSSISQLNELGWHYGNSEGSTHPVGEKTPNAWGLYDMHGNVWEFCRDWRDAVLQGGVDPQGAESGGGRSRALRGGAYLFGDAKDFSSAYRDYTYDPPSNSYGGLGFRLVCTLP